jgi:hypothetical protein
MNDFWTDRVETPATGPDGWRIFLKLHRSEESYRFDSIGIESRFLTHERGRKTYVLARPCVLQPHFTLTAALYPEPSPTGEIGRVVGTEWEGMDTREIGNAQAWHYHADGVLVLWECYLFEHVRQGPGPAYDARHTAVWQAFEDVLVSWFTPGLIVTPAWEPVYRREDWQTFLRQTGYRVVDNVGIKSLASEGQA